MAQVKDIIEFERNRMVEGSSRFEYKDLQSACITNKMLVFCIEDADIQCVHIVNPNGLKLEGPVWH